MRSFPLFCIVEAESNFLYATYSEYWVVKTKDYKIQKLEIVPFVFILKREI